MTTLLDASNQWASRPEDERFESLHALHQHCASLREECRDITAHTSELRCERMGGDGLVLTRGSNAAAMTNHAFGQLCSRIKAPQGYLATLPNTMAAQLVNHGIQNDETGNAVLLMREHRDNGDPYLELRGIASKKYGRIWNADITSRLLELPQQGWRVPPARPARPGQRGTRRATHDDVLRSEGIAGLSIQVGDEIAPAGLYASDRDMFAFLVNEDAPIDDGRGHPTYRGFFVSNAETPGQAFKFTCFLYDHVCGNHIVWGAKVMGEIRVRHVGKYAKARAFHDLEIELRNYANASAAIEQDVIRQARTLKLGMTGEEVVDAIFKQSWCQAPKKALEESYVLAGQSYDEHQTDPHTAWGMVEGLTRYSQTLPHASARTAVDRTAGRIPELVF